VSTSYEVHIPSTKVASFSVASAVTSVFSGGVGSRTSVARSSPPATVLVSSPSQDRSVDFLHHMRYTVLHAQLVIHATTWEISKTYKVDRTTVTVGAPRMLALSMIPASAVASSSAWASSGYSGTVAGERPVLLFAADVCELSAPAACCAGAGTTSSMDKSGLVLLLGAAATVSQVSSSPWSTGSEGGISYDNTN
jgi:hypothetical protein